jgi:hypothetical protein
MKEIQLAHDRGIALVDDDDFELVSQYVWSLKTGTETDGLFYARRSYRDAGGSWRTQYLHQLITGASGAVHMDHDGLNCQRANLKPASYSDRLARQRRRRNNTSGHPGVHWREDVRKWSVRVSKDGHRYAVGLFDGVGAFTIQLSHAETCLICLICLFF